MKSRHIPMPPDEYHRLAWEPGWKYEYWDGTAHISPRDHIICCARATEPRYAVCPFALTPIGPEDTAGLVDAYLAAFRDGIEYCDWPEEKVVQDAWTTIHGFLANRHGTVLPASRLARENSNAQSPVLGAAFVVQSATHVALIDAVYVVPDRQRRGVATAMVTSALSALYDAGFHTLESRFLLGNNASMAWHRQLGFKESPDLLTARLTLAHAQHELTRRQSLGNPDAEALQKLREEVLFRQNEVQRLEAIADSEGLEAVMCFGRRGKEGR
jgi:GNAT superfamily N-acetyltransferase